MAQNIYDDEEFFSGYSTLARSVHGHDGAPEWPTLRLMLPDLEGRRVLDLGCGFGWFSRWAADNGAGGVVGIDLSERMLEKARAETVSSVVTYLRLDLDAVELEAGGFDVAYSSLTLHYLQDIPAFLRQVMQTLRVGGVFVFSVEHPMFTAPTNPGFVSSTDGSLTWPVANYSIEGPRLTNWFAPGIEKQHRTIGTYVNSLIRAGFQIDTLIEWGPTAEQIETVPAWASELHRPPFLLIRAHRP
jgi:SAM-dependent methyltransferase